MTNEHESSKPGRQPLGDHKRSERVVLKMTKTQLETLKDKHGLVPLGTALMDHCEKTGFFPENHSSEAENCYADHPKIDEVKQSSNSRWNPSDWFQSHVKKGGW